MRGLKVGFGDRLVMDGLDLDLYRGEVLGFVGASGAGKSVLTRTIFGLIHKQAGTIEVFGHDIDKLGAARTAGGRRAMGRPVSGGRAVLQLDRAAEHPGADARASEPVPVNAGWTGGPKAGACRPAAGHGRQASFRTVRRHDEACFAGEGARARPEIVFLDEPTSGLDPISAGDFDDLIGTLQKTLGLTVFMVTHDLDSLYAICDRVAVLGHGKVMAVGPIDEVLLSEDPWIKSYFHGKRGVVRARAAEERPA